jgi:hypothetical protein
MEQLGEEFNPEYGGRDPCSKTLFGEFMTFTHAFSAKVDFLERNLNIRQALFCSRRFSYSVLSWI